MCAKARIHSRKTCYVLRVALKSERAKNFEVIGLKYEENLVIDNQRKVRARKVGRKFGKALGCFGPERKFEVYHFVGIDHFANRLKISGKNNRAWRKAHRTPCQQNALTWNILTTLDRQVDTRIR